MASIPSALGFPQWMGGSTPNPVQPNLASRPLPNTMQPKYGKGVAELFKQGSKNMGGSVLKNSIPKVAPYAEAAGVMAIAPAMAAATGYASRKAGQAQQANTLSWYTPAQREEMAKRNDVMGISQSASEAWRQPEPWPVSAHEKYVPKTPAIPPPAKTPTPAKVDTLETDTMQYNNNIAPVPITPLQTIPYKEGLSTADYTRNLSALPTTLPNATKTSFFGDQRDTMIDELHERRNAAIQNDRSKNIMSAISPAITQEIGQPMQRFHYENAANVATADANTKAQKEADLTKYNEVKGALGLLNAKNKGAQGAKGSETNYFDSGRANYYINTLKALREQMATMDKNSPEYKATVAQAADLLKTSIAHSNLPSKPATALGTRNTASDELPDSN